MPLISNVYEQYPAYPPPKFYSIDVECVATGNDHNARAVGQISLVDEYERVLLNIYVRPEEPITSYLTPLTGLTKEMLDTHGLPLAQAMKHLRDYLPPYAILVGQNIGKDVHWLSLREGIDFESMVDLAGLYKFWNAQFNSWSIFSLDHMARIVLGLDSHGAPHNAVGDALKSIRLFNYYRVFSQNPVMMGRVRDALMNNPIQDSFAKRYPLFEGVCMGNRKKCSCGAPFLG